MTTKFQINDPSLESQWRALILFGKNSATYKFAFAKSLLELINNETTKISLKELSKPFSKNIIEHLKHNDKQGNSKSSTFLNICRDHIKGQIPDVFYEKNYKAGNKEIIIKDSLLKLKESFHFQNLSQEVEARWNLVETAWNLKINPALLEVKYDENKSLFFIENDFMRRTDITSVRDSLNGYQKGKCFYSFQDISVVSGSSNLCEVDHFLPHLNKEKHNLIGANINGVWNLVLANKEVNRNKSSRIPEKRFLERLHNRNEFYIESKHPLAETIINQTGKTKQQRIKFLNKQYQLALDSAIITWKPEIELIGNF